jgi:hypothetical protein
MTNMGERIGMLRLATLAFAVCAAAGVAGPVHAGERTGSAIATDVSAQQRDPAVRQRPRIRVTPRYPDRNYPYRTWHSFYPLPYDVEYPGPNAYRQCDFRLAQEARPSGTVIVPRRRCWWVRR